MGRCVGIAAAFRLSYSGAALGWYGAAMRNAARSAFVVATVIVILASWAAPTLACTVSYIATDVDDVGGDLVFTGTAVARNDTAPSGFRSGLTWWTFVVDTVHRGPVGDRVSVQTGNGGGDCGAAFELGHRYALGTSPPGWAVTFNNVVEVPPLANPPRVETPYAVDMVFTLLLVATVGVALLVLSRRARARSSTADQPIGGLRDG